MDDRQARLDRVAHIAVALEAQTGCPAALLVAQWAIESEWGAKPAGHDNYFGVKREARHTKWCTVTTEEVFTPLQLETWNHQHAASPARVIATLPDGRQRVEIDDEFADYDSLDASCQDYTWLITHGTPYREAWRQYQRDKNLAALIRAVARVYATAPRYADMAEEIATQSNVLQAIAGASAAPVTATGLPG